MTDDGRRLRVTRIELDGDLEEGVRTYLAALREAGEEQLVTMPTRIWDRTRAQIRELQAEVDAHRHGLIRISLN